MADSKRTRFIAIGFAGLALLGLAAWLLMMRGEPGGASSASGVGDASANGTGAASAWSRPTPPASAPTARGSAGAADGGAARFSSGIIAGWGAGLSQLGRSIPEEGNPEAPMSFAVDARGNAWVLDQVNGRLVRYDGDGNAREAVPVAQQAPQDIAVGKDGTTAVLDRLRDKSVALMKDGRLVGDLPIEGKGIEEGGGVTGVFLDGKDVYVEREHGSLVKIGDTDGTANADRPEIPGRPSRDGKSYLLAGLVDPPAGRLYVNAVDRATEERRFTRELRAQVPVLTLVLLDSDLSGTIYVGALLEPGASGALVRVWCLSSVDGTPLGSADLPANTGPEETFREIVVLDGGGMLYAQRSATGATYVRYDCR